MVNVPKKLSKQDGRAFLKQALIGVEEQFQQDLSRKRRSITHDGTMGDAVEDDWIVLLRKYLPTRYVVAKGFAIDHVGNTTDQMDCIIYDSHFTPSLFGENNHQYIPAEAVYAGFEIKQTVSAVHLRYAAEKIASLRELQRTSAPIPWINGVNSRKEPFQIIGGLLAMEASWKDGLGRHFFKNNKQLKGKKKLDFVLTAKDGFFDQSRESGLSTTAHGPGSLIQGLFRLLTALRDRATVSAVEWDKYESVLITEN